MPSGAIWDYYCLRKGAPVGIAFMDAIEDYEKHELSKRY
jgi:L-rhamnose isomerase